MSLRPSAGPVSGVSAVRVLVIDRNEDAAESLALILRLSGYSVRTAADGLAGVDAITGFAPHAVILELRLAGLDGFGVIEWTAARPVERRPFMIVLTGYLHDHDRHRLSSLGVGRIVLKPADPAELVDFLSGVCGPSLSEEGALLPSG